MDRLVRLSWLFNKILQWDFKYISLHHASLCWLCKKQFCLKTSNFLIQSGFFKFWRPVAKGHHYICCYSTLEMSKIEKNIPDTVVNKTPKLIQDIYSVHKRKVDDSRTVRKYNRKLLIVFQKYLKYLCIIVL